MTTAIKATDSGLRYGVEYRDGLHVMYLDHHHNNANGGYPDANCATYAFKDRHPHAILKLAPLVVDIATEGFKWVTGVTHVAFILGRNDLTADFSAATYHVASGLAEAKGLILDTKSFTQTRSRDGLHHGPSRNRAQRKAILADVVDVIGDLTGRCYILVDDVYTTGASIHTYKALIERAGGRVCGAVVLMRYANEMELLNPKLYEPIAKSVGRTPKDRAEIEPEWTTYLRERQEFAKLTGARHDADVAYLTAFDHLVNMFPFDPRHMDSRDLTQIDEAASALTRTAADMALCSQETLATLAAVSYRDALGLLYDAIEEYVLRQYEEEGDAALRSQEVCIQEAARMLTLSRSEVVRPLSEHADTDATKRVTSRTESQSIKGGFLQGAPVCSCRTPQLEALEPGLVERCADECEIDVRYFFIECKGCWSPFVAAYGRAGTIVGALDLNRALTEPHFRHVELQESERAMAQQPSA